MQRDWELLDLQSPAVTAQAIQEAIEQGELDEASKGIRELAHVLGKEAKKGSDFMYEVPSSRATGKAVER